MSDTRHLCPRRSELGSPHSNQLSKYDSWNKSHCTHCGSLEPDLLMALIEAKQVELTPTDKNYKVYVTPNSDYTGFIGGKGLRDHDKFYFQHLTKEQRQRFVELHNDHTLILRDPEYFYTPPFFMKPVDLLDPNAGDEVTVIGEDA